LDDKTVIYVTDLGSNVANAKACEVAGPERFGCAALGLHNLVTVDVISKGTDVQTIVCKVNDCIRTFTFKSSLL
jgi:hypothetical protein